jgi:hypothetical protein
MRNIIIVLGLFLFSNSWAEGDVPAEHLLTALDNGTQLIQKMFKTDASAQPSVKIFELQSDNYALFFEADMDIDCDGEPDDKCNENTDPWFYPALSVGTGIYASQTPFYVVPVSFDHEQYGVELGSVGAVIYKNKVSYGPLLDKCGVDDVIGEASYATAEYLGINPDPRVGGTDGPVAYICFAGPSAQIGSDNYANHERAVELGNARAKEIVEFFGVSPIENNKYIIGLKRILRNKYNISLPKITITSAGSHTVTVTNFKGQQVATWQGDGIQAYSLSDLSSGVYVIKIATPAASVVERAIMY